MNVPACLLGTPPSSDCVVNRTRLRGNRCQCPSCGENFYSTYTFDRHRIDQFGVNEWLELVQLAEILCPLVMLDLPVLMELEAYGLLLWLRSRAQESLEAQT